MIMHFSPSATTEDQRSWQRRRNEHIFWRCDDCGQHISVKVSTDPLSVHRCRKPEVEAPLEVVHANFGEAEADAALAEYLGEYPPLCYHTTTDMGGVCLHCGALQ